MFCSAVQCRAVLQCSNRCLYDFLPLPSPLRAVRPVDTTINATVQWEDTLVFDSLFQFGAQTTSLLSYRTLLVEKRPNCDSSRNEVSLINYRSLLAVSDERVIPGGDGRHGQVSLDVGSFTLKYWPLPGETKLCLKVLVRNFQLQDGTKFPRPHQFEVTATIVVDIVNGELYSH